MRNKFFTAASLLLLAVLLAVFGTAAAQALSPVPQETPAETPRRTISVNGSGQAILTPDLAYITIGVQTQENDATEAVASNTQQAQKVIDALRSAGIDAKDIQTTNFSIFPQQQFDNEGKPTGEITYIVDNSVYVTVRDLDMIGSLLDAAVQAGANNIYGIQFDVADRTEALSEARQAAIDNARSQAEEVAQVAGVSLGDVQTINVYGSVPPVPLPKGGAMVEAAMDVPVSAGQLIVTVEVNLVYAIQ